MTVLYKTERERRHGTHDPASRWEGIAALIYGGLEPGKSLGPAAQIRQWTYKRAAWMSKVTKRRLRHG